jgi:feruloyl-CoA synthase
MRSAEPLSSYDQRMGDWLDRWAREAPDRLFLIEQHQQKAERAITYREAREAARAHAQNRLG